jgi:hypothetical protein
VLDSHLNSIHLDLSRREEFRRARQVMLEARGTNTIQFDAKPYFRNGQRGETIADAPKPDSVAKPHCGFVLLVDKKAQPLRVGVNTIGRLPDNDVVISDPHASRRHCSVLVHTNMRCELHDMASKNGTYLNGQRLTCSTLLRPNDEIRIGDLKFIFSNGNELTNGGDSPHHTSIISPGTPK